MKIKTPGTNCSLEDCEYWDAEYRQNCKYSEDENKCVYKENVKDEVSQKPSIDLISETIWEQQRIEDLAEAINKHIMKGVYSPQINVWIDELQKRVRNFI